MNATNAPTSKGVAGAVNVMVIIVSCVVGTAFFAMCVCILSAINELDEKRRIERESRPVSDAVAVAAPCSEAVETASVSTIV